MWPEAGAAAAVTAAAESKAAATATGTTQMVAPAAHKKTSRKWHTRCALLHLRNCRSYAARGGHNTDR